MLEMQLEQVPLYRQDGTGKPDFNFLPVYVLFTIFIYLLETYLDLRQHRLLKEKTTPAALLEALNVVDSENKGLGAVAKVMINIFYCSVIWQMQPRSCDRDFIPLNQYKFYKL